MQHTTPAAPAVRETLEKLLASQTFGRSERARELLRYLVEREQAGEASRLKGFAIAVDVFGKDAGFDPSTDAVVRVQAGRLRELLQQYSATEGVNDPIRITIPRGGYVPQYEVTETGVPFHQITPSLQPQISPASEHPSPAAPGKAPAAEADRRQTPGSSGTLMIPPRHLRAFWVFAAIFLVVMVVLVILLLRQADEPGRTPVAAGASATPAPDSTIVETLGKLPAISLVVEGNTPPVQRVEAILRSGLAHLETIQFIDRDPRQDPPQQVNPTSFVFNVKPGTTVGNVTIEVQNLKTGRILTSETLTSFQTTASQVTDRVAKILGDVTGQFGSIYGYIEQNGLQNDLTACVLLGRAYASNQGAKSHEAAYRCLENLIARGEKSAFIYALLAGLELDATVWAYPYPATSSVQQAMVFVNKAIQIDPTSSRAFRMAAYAEGVLGNSQERVRWAKKAYDAAPYDLRTMYHYGWALVMAGSYSEGTALLARGLDLADPHGKWLDYALFQGAFMTGNPELQRRAALALAAVEPLPEYLLAQLIVARHNGKKAEVARLLTEIKDKFPTFAEDPRATFVKNHYPDDLSEKLVQAFKTASLEYASMVASPTVPPTPSVAVPVPGLEDLPTVYLVNTESSTASERVIAALRDGLSRFDTLEFVRKEVPSKPTPTSFSFHVQPGPTTGSVTVELQNLATGRVLSVRKLEAFDATASQIDNSVGNILAETASVPGTIYSYLQQVGLQRGLTRCLLLSNSARVHPQLESFKNAYQCLEMIERNGAKSTLVYAELSNLILNSLIWDFRYPEDATVEKAATLAQHAVEIDPDSSQAYGAKAFVASRLGDREGTVKWAKMAYDLNPYDLATAANYGSALFFKRDYKNGMALLTRAIDGSGAVHPAWWDYKLFCGAFMLGDQQIATRAALSLTAAGADARFLAARLIVASQSDDRRKASALLDQIRTKFPDFAANPRSMLEEWKFVPEEMTDKLVSALENAGLGRATASANPPAHSDANIGVGPEDLPIAYVVSKKADPATEQVAAALRAGLSRFETVNFIGRDPADDRNKAADATSFVFNITPGPGTGWVTVELQNLQTGTVALSRTIAVSDTTSAQIEPQIGKILGDTTPVSGLIYTFLERNGFAKGLTACLILENAFELEANAKVHEKAYRCFEALAANHAKSSMVYSSLSTLTTTGLIWRYAYPLNSSLDKAGEFAQRAIQANPSSPRAYNAKAYISNRLGIWTDTVQWTSKAYQMNPYDPQAIASYAYALIFSGDYVKGTSTMIQAIDAADGAHAAWWDYGLFAGAYMQGDKELAAKAISPIATAAPNPLFLTSRLVIASEVGNQQMVNDIIGQLNANFPAFVANPRATFTKRNYPPGMVEKFIQGLRTAGLSGAT